MMYVLTEIAGWNDDFGVGDVVVGEEDDFEEVSG